MRQRSWLVQPFALILCSGAISVAQAQPDPNNMPKGANPPQTVQPPVVLHGNVVIQQQWQGGWQPLNPGQPMIPQQMQEQMLEQSARAQLGANGFTDKTLQDAVVEFLKAQEKARQPLREKANKLSETIRLNVATDAQISALVNEFRAAIEDEKTRSVDALKALNAKIGYSKKPRLEALLLMLGFIGDESSYLKPPGNNTGMFGPPGIFVDNFGGMPGANVRNFNGPLVFGLPDNGVQNWAMPATPLNKFRNYYYHLVPPGVTPAVPNGATNQQRYRLYTAPNAVPPNAVPPAAGQPGLAKPGQPNDFVVTPPVIPPGDVITAPAVGFDDLVIPPQEPAPPVAPEILVEPEVNGLVQINPLTPQSPAPKVAPDGKGGK